MAQAKRVSKGKRPNKTVSVLGIAGVSSGRVDQRIVCGHTAGASRSADPRAGSRYALAECGAV